jgi:fumarate hydratase, class I
MTTIIKGEDLVQSIADAFQFISYYHPADYVRHLAKAYEIEESQTAKDAIAQILVNSRMSALGKRPICQDTGIAAVFLSVGMGVRFDTDRSLDDLVNEGVRRAYTDATNPLRASVVFDPLFTRVNTRDNAPAVIHTSWSPAAPSR